MHTVQNKEDMNIVIVGHVDHGKSTLMGRLLADTDSLPLGKLEQVKETCRRNSKPFEYAFLLDALKDEQAQGITIDAARCFFNTEKRNYIILDAPGHIEFLKNMITGAARAEAAMLVIDAKEGVQENSRRHGYMLSMLGIKQIAVAINKMDLVDYREDVYEKVKKEYLEFLQAINVEARVVLPISSFHGDNIVMQSENMPWYDGMTILEVLDDFKCEKENIEQAFRMPVQDVYKFTKNGDDRRIVAGTIETGIARVGDEVIFYPSGKKSYIKTVEAFHAPTMEQAQAGMSTGFTLNEQIYIKRGELMTLANQDHPQVATRIQANIFWLGKKNLVIGKQYFMKIGTDKVSIELEEVCNTINSSDLSAEKKDYVGRNEVAECVFKTERDIAFDLVINNAAMSRFVIIDQYEITGGGIITDVKEDKQSQIRNQVLLRNYKWEHSSLSTETRSERYSQKPLLLLLTGEKNVGKRKLAKELERFLLENGRFVYYLGIGTFLYGVDSDLKLLSDNHHEEHMRRFAETANLMLDAGMILIVTARSLLKADIEIMKTIISGDIDTIWVGDTITTDLKVDLTIKDVSRHDNMLLIKERLKDKGIIFKG